VLPPGRSSRRTLPGLPATTLRPPSSGRRPRRSLRLALALLAGLSATAARPADAQPAPGTPPAIGTPPPVGTAPPAGSAPASGTPPAAGQPGGRALGLLDAVRLTLERDPNLGVVQARLDSSRGALLAASGRFDPVVTDRLLSTETRIPVGGNASEDNRTVEEDLGVSQLFRTGLSISPTLQLLRTADNLSEPEAGNAGTLTFTLRQPLLRGRGRAATAAVEIAAGREVQASALDLLHATAQRVQAVVSQYWTVAAAQADLAVLGESEGSSRDLLATTRKLIEADVTPAAEIIQLQANLAAKETARIGGELALFQARQELGHQIGLDAPEIRALPPAADPFPTLAPGALPSVPPGADTARWVALAVAHRADLQAARARLAEADVQVSAAENARLPQLDLVLAPGYNGFAPGPGFPSFFYPFLRNVPGASVSLGLELTLPTGNRIARGQLAQALASRRESALAVDLVAKEIGANVPSALEAVARDAEQLDRATLAVRLFEKAVDNEEKKLRGGTSTILDVITQRDRLTSARQSEVQSRLALAQALVTLRFETGTLVAGAAGAAGAAPAGAGELTYADLATVPTP
jgi:outer membrane protein